MKMEIMIFVLENDIENMKWNVKISFILHFHAVMCNVNYGLEAFKNFIPNHPPSMKVKFNVDMTLLLI